MMLKHRRRSLALMIAASLGPATVGACREPTEITLVLSTDVPCADWRNATVTAGRREDVETASPGAVTSACSPSGDLGTLVFIPSGSKGESVSLKIVGGDGRSPQTCGASGDVAGCIVQRRTLRFIPHTPLRLLVSVARRCSGVVCPAEQTCDPRFGLCTSSVVDPTQCTGAGCDSSALQTDAGAAADAGDAAPLEDAGGDAGSGDAGSGDAGSGRGCCGDPCTQGAQCNSCCCNLSMACDLRHDCNFAGGTCL